jgi:hypothetical protein
MTKATQGGWLIFAGLIVGFMTWTVRADAASDHSERARAVAGYTTELTGRLTDPEPFNNAPYIVAAIIAALLVVCGVILYASDSSSSDSSGS